MSRYCLNTPEVKKTKKLLFKYNEFEVKTNRISGKVTIKNWRKYNYYNEIDIIFEGEIFVKMGKKKVWINSSVLNLPNVSLILSNKLIRKYVWKDTKDFLNYFSISLKVGQFTIKKVKWL
jgi:hypothetical protein